MKSARELFKEMCEGEFAELKDAISDIEEKHNCLVMLKSKKIIVEIEDPFNINNMKSYVFKYRSGVLDEIYALLNEIDDTLRTAYRPHLISMKPLIALALSGVISNLECDEYEAILSYVGDEKVRRFDYTPASYEEFVSYITDLVESNSRTLAIPEHKTCVNHAEHCHHCGNTSCEHNAGLIKSLWNNMSPEEQQHIKEIFDDEKLALLEKAIS